MMFALKRRFTDHSATPQVRYTQAIVNHGREAGASLAHPHGQLLGLPFKLSPARHRLDSGRCRPIFGRSGLKAPHRVPVPWVSSATVTLLQSVAEP